MRKYLSPDEINNLLIYAKKDKLGVRNYCMLLMCYIHGFRVSELLNIKISDIEIQSRRIFVSRLKNGFSTIHPLQKKEVSAIESWLTLRKKWLRKETDWLFISENDNQRLTRQSFYHIVKKIGKNAKMIIDVHPHMLRHACGYALAEDGKDTRLIQDYLGHRNIKHTVLYTASNPERFSSITL